MTGPLELTCRELVDFLAEYLDGTLAPDVRQAFAAHVADCAACAAYLRGYADTIRLVKRAYSEPDHPVPRDVPEDLVRAILAARRPS
jgi:anti-sigma factor RsiW